MITLIAIMTPIGHAGIAVLIGLGTTKLFPGFEVSPTIIAVMLYFLT